MQSWVGSQRPSSLLVSPYVSIMLTIGGNKGNRKLQSFSLSVPVNLNSIGPYYRIFIAGNAEVIKLGNISMAGVIYFN